jgi:hypothetical protein
MRVHVTDLSEQNPAAPFTEELATICGDDADCCAEVAELLARDGECVIGGGAAPAYRIARADH